MTTRLLQYEFKSGAVVFPASWALITALYGLVRLANALEVPVVSGFMILAMVMIGIGTMVYAVVLPVLRYHQTMFGKEAYLIQTLPVSKSKLLLSKLLLAGIYYVFGAFALILLAFALNSISGGEILPILESALQMMGGYGLVWFLLAATLIQGFTTICLLYFSITLANTAKFIKNNILFSVVFYFAGDFLIGIISVVAMLFIPFGLEITFNSVHIVFKPYINIIAQAASANNPDLTSGGFGLGSLITSVFIGILLLVLTEKLLRNKASVK